MEGSSAVEEMYGVFKKAMHFVVLKGDIEAIVFLINSHLIVNGIENGVTPLHLAVATGDARMVKTLLSFGVNLQMLNDDGLTPLHLAVVFNRIALFEDLMDKNYLETPNRYGNSALHMAVIRGNADAVNALLKLGANATMPNKEGHAPLQLAINLGKAEVIDAIRKYADKKAFKYLNDVNPFCEESSLHTAAKFGNLEDIEGISYLQENMNLRNSKGLAAIHIAVIHNQVSAVKTLVRCGACIDCEDNLKNTPIHWAVKLNNIPVLKLLCRMGAMTCLVNALGDTPFHSAILADNIQAVRVLFQYTRSKTLLLGMTNFNRMTPLHVAVCFGDKEILRELIRYYSGFTCYGLLHTAADFCNLVGISSLLKYKATACGQVATASELFDRNDKCLTPLEIVLFFVKKNTFKSALKSLSDRYKNLNLKRSFPLTEHEILSCARKIVKYAILRDYVFGQHTKLDKPEYTADIIPIIQNYIKDCFAECNLIKSTFETNYFSPSSFFDPSWYGMLAPNSAQVSEVLLDSILDVATTKAYPLYRDCIISRLERPTLLKKLLHMKIYAKFNGKTINLDSDTIPLISKHLSKRDIVNLLLAYSNLNEDFCAADSLISNKRKYSESQYHSGTEKKKA